MNASQLLTVGLLLLTLISQAAVPRLRLLIVTSGAAATSLIAALSVGATTRSLLAGVPWDVIVIVISLGLLSELLASSRIFALASVWVTRVSRGDPTKILLLSAVGMYLASGLVNNLTALLLVLPVLLRLFSLLSVSRRYVRWTLGALLVACNLGGAATPIGDFPAILLLSRGSMSFTGYLERALPQTALALAATLLLILALRPARDVEQDPLSARLALRTMHALHRNIRAEPRALWSGALALGGMLVAWTLVPASSGIGPEAVAWLGAAAALAAAPELGERLLRRRVDVEAALFLFSLFVLVGAVRETGAIDVAAGWLLALPLSPTGQLAVFLVAAAALTGLFSAGPSMAALLDVAGALAERLPPETVYVGLAMSVCAGSSLFLTAATSGPLAQALTERAELYDPSGAPIRFEFSDFVPVGALSFSVILATGLLFAL